ncbi:MAG TPA: phasin family protein [Xanthobacteraceae bacterium]|nr:phasin family protein [Xanthobacteraceae bacterium]
MTKQQKWTPESPIEACATTYESLAKALGGLQNKFEIPDAAREFVKRSAAAAKDRSSDLHAGANKVTGAVEEALVGAVNGLADLNRKIVDATYQDLEAAFAAIDKLASAESLTDGFETYVDYLRQQSKVGVARAKDVTSLVSTKASEGFDALRDGIAKFMTVRSQAA